MRGKLAIILLICFFASPIAAKELTGTLQQIKKSGQIKIGYRLSEPPMSFLDKDDNPIGYSIDLCKHIVTEVENRIGADIKVKYVPVTAEERFQALATTKSTYYAAQRLKRFPVVNLLTLRNLPLSPVLP